MLICNPDCIHLDALVLLKSKHLSRPKDPQKTSHTTSGLEGLARDREVPLFNTQIFGIGKIGIKQIRISGHSITTWTR